MSLKNLNIKRSYKSLTDINTIPKDLINPCLKEAILYQRSVGYFSSSVFSSIKEGIRGINENKGKIQLITTPMLSKEDIEAINLGIKIKNEIITGIFEDTYKEEISKLADDNLITLASLIADKRMEIKIVTTKSNGEYHDKFGIITDINDDSIVFFGSSNSSNNGYVANYEKVRVARSWNVFEEEAVNDEMEEFLSLWNDTNSFVDVCDFSEAAEKGVLKEMEKRNITVHKIKEKNDVVELRDYQKDAINSWVNNNYNGFFVMATGTGKTFTAIYGLKKLLTNDRRIAVIIAPYKHLIKQWCVDLEKVFPNAKIIMAFSENQKWYDQIQTELVKLNFIKDTQLIIVSTMITFSMDRFTTLMNKSKIKKVLIVDEAHRFTNRTDDIRTQYENMLGLSATPTNGKNIEESTDLVNFFGGVVFNMPIERALDEGFLIPYKYYPIFVSATEEDESEFQSLTQQMAACFKDGRLVEKEKLLRLSKSRLRIISNCENKINVIEKVISENVVNKDHLVVYCGDGKLFQNTDEGLRYINHVKKIMNTLHIRTSQFTSSENMKERMDLVDLFNSGIIESLVAIKCLDEGINIPSIKTALILSSNDDLKEFVQRRGRILRKHNSKSYAEIYDIVVLPSTYAIGMAKIELRRVYEYARLSMNYDTETKDNIFELLKKYNIDLKDIVINDMFFEEDYGDE